MRNKVCSFALSLLTLAIAGCGTAERRQLLADAPFLTTAVTDAYGQSIGFRGTPRSVVALSNNQAFLLCELEAFELLTGRPEGCIVPDTIVGIPGISTFPTIDFQRLGNLHPDAVLVNTTDIANADSLRDQLAEAGLAVLAQRYETLDDLYANALQLGRVLGRTPQAEQFNARMQHYVEQVRVRAQPGDTLRVVVVLQLQPLTVVAGKSLAHTLIGLSGGQNPFGVLQVPYAEVKPDSLLSSRADVLLLPPNEQNVLEQLLALHPQLAALPAVKNQRAYELDPNGYLSSGPQTAQALLVLAGAIRPGAGIPALYQQLWEQRIPVSSDQSAVSNQP